MFIIERYERQLFAYIKRLMKISDGDAEDILQEVFIKTYENLNDFDRDLKFSSWIYRITYNHTISYYRKNKAKLQMLSLEDNEIIFEKLRSEFNLTESIDKKILKEKIQELLDQLDKKYKDVLILKYLEEKNYTEISNILRKPMGTIATLLNRAKDKFREILANNHFKYE
ncbi:MAG: sigma-70 family RNA polymerase sigma factor [Nitrospirae bacterium]|nr:sigma-70 family RNA polymerase sigma factor [Nitrospirota bacterium]